jgi:hypothetical protein
MKKPIKYYILVMLVFACVSAYSDEKPNLTTDWIYQSNSFSVNITNLQTNSVQISPAPNIRALGTLNVTQTDLQESYLDRKRDGIIYIEIIFLMNSDHPEIAGYTRGGRVLEPKVIPPGGHLLINCPLNQNFISAASFSEKALCFLRYDGKIISSESIKLFSRNCN